MDPASSVGQFNKKTKICSSSTSGHGSSSSTSRSCTVHHSYDNDIVIVVAAVYIHTWMYDVQKFKADGDDLLRNMMGLLGNVAEVQFLRSHFMNPQFISICRSVHCLLVGRFTANSVAYKDTAF